MKLTQVRQQHSRKDSFWREAMTLSVTNLSPSVDADSTTPSCLSLDQAWCRIYFASLFYSTHSPFRAYPSVLQRASWFWARSRHSLRIFQPGLQTDRRVLRCKLSANKRKREQLLQTKTHSTLHLVWTHSCILGLSRTPQAWDSWCSWVTCSIKRGRVPAGRLWLTCTRPCTLAGLCPVDVSFCNQDQPLSREQWTFPASSSFFLRSQARLLGTAPCQLRSQRPCRSRILSPMQLFVARRVNELIQ